MKTIQVANGTEPWIALGAILLGVLCFWIIMRLVVRIGRPKENKPEEKKTRCKWKRMARKDQRVLKAWTCASCTELAYTTTGKPPTDCKRGLSPRAL